MFDKLGSEAHIPLLGELSIVDTFLGEEWCFFITHTLGMMHWKARLTFSIMVISCVKHVSPHAKHIAKVDVFKTELYPKKCLLGFVNVINATSISRDGI